MNLLNPKRCSLVLLTLLVSMSLFLILPESCGEEDLPDWLKSGQEENTEEIIEVQEISEGSEAEVVEAEEVVAAAEEEVAPGLTTTRMFQIKNLDIEQAREKIEKLLSEDEKIGAGVEVFTILRAGEEVNFLVVKDTPRKLEGLAQIIEGLEKEFAPVTVDLDFTDVPLSQVLSTIAHSTGLNIIGGEALSENITISLKDVPIEDVFDIVLKSTEYTYVKDGNILRIVSNEEMPLTTEVFELQFAFAEQIREAISHLISGKGKVKAFSKFSEEAYSNVLIVTDTPRSLDSIRNVVKQLDKKIGQVMIEVKFCEVTLDKDDKFGVEHVLQASLTGASTQTRFPLASVGAKQLDRPDTRAQTSGTITLGTISFANFSATLYALDTKTKIEIISNPRVATRDGEEAEIIIGSRIPIPIYERHRETAGLIISGYQDEEVGVVLKVTPVINRDNTVTLKLNPEVSEVSSWTGPDDERPVISTTEVNTIFTVENGQTVVLGGLMKQTLTNTVKKIPGLGSIPLLGRFFRYNYDAKDRKELLIFITPYILESSEKVLKSAELSDYD